MQNQFLIQALALIQSNLELACAIAAGSVLCLVLVITKVHNRKTASERKIAAALAHAIKDDLL